MGLFRRGEASASSAAAPAIAKVVKAEPLKTHKDETTWRFILLVKPDGSSPFGAMIEQKLPNSVGTPGQWKRVPVTYDPASKERTGKETVVDISRLGSVDLTEPIPAEVHVNGIVVGSGPRWIVPHECPGCGGVVDQAKESMLADPKCAFCGQPLPVEAAPPAPGMSALNIINRGAEA